MISFKMWLITEARFQPEEEYSWVWHPLYGVFVDRGYMAHIRIFKSHPDLKQIPVVEHGEENLKDYDPPRGFANVDRKAKTITYSRYDQSKFNIAGTTDAADAQQVDRTIRSQYHISHDIKSVIYGPTKFWYNTHSDNFTFKN